MPLPAAPSIPIPSLVSSVFSAFPLVTYPAPTPSSPAPSTPTLWLLGPPPSTSKESLDPLCRQAQALARFTSTSYTPRYLPHALSAPGSTLPALHLPSGALLSATEALEHLLTPAHPKGAASPSAALAAADAKHAAFLSLVQATLLPAVLAAVYLAPPTPALAVVPRTPRPVLAEWAAGWDARQDRRDRIDEILMLRGKKVGVRAVLDLEELEREGTETIAALEDVVLANGADKGFGPAS